MPQPSMRQMTEADIPQAMRLKDIAGWNQVAADWKLLMALEPQGCWVAEQRRRIVATATAVRFENRFGWVGMVIVDPDFRRRGIATRMVTLAIEYLESSGCPCQKLDATDAGARVYERMGFQVECRVERWQRPAAHLLPGPVGSSRLENLEQQGLPALLELDQKAFGANRRPLLEWYCRQATPRFSVWSETVPEGFVVGRPGSSAVQMGPLVARKTGSASRLMRSFLAALGPVETIADVIAANKAARRSLRRLGFSRRRVLYRMFRGRNSFPSDPETTFCLSGFELG